MIRIANPRVAEPALMACLELMFYIKGQTRAKPLSVPPSSVYVLFGRFSLIQANVKCRNPLALDPKVNVELFREGIVGVKKNLVIHANLPSMVGFRNPSPEAMKTKGD